MKFCDAREPDFTDAHGEGMNDFVGRFGDASVRPRKAPGMVFARFAANQPDGGLRPDAASRTVGLHSRIV